MSGHDVLTGGGTTGIAVNLTGSSATVIEGNANYKKRVVWFRCSENNGGTPNLTVEIYDGTNHFYMGDAGGSTWNAKAMTAKQSVKFDDGYTLGQGQYIRVTSSDASGHISVTGDVKLLPN